MDEPQSSRDDAQRVAVPLDTDRGYAPGGGYSDGTFPEDCYRWRSTATRGYGSQDEFTRHPEDAFRRTAGGGERDRPGAQRTARHANAEGHAQASPRSSSERVSPLSEVEEVGYRRIAYRDD